MKRVTPNSDKILMARVTAVTLPGSALWGWWGINGTAQHRVKSWGLNSTLNAKTAFNIFRGIQQDFFETAPKEIFFENCKKPQHAPYVLTKHLCVIVKHKYMPHTHTHPSE